MQSNLPESWCIKSFKDSFSSVSPIFKMKQKEYLDTGLYPIIDQGESFIGGYTNSDAGIISDIPLIVFGDHTRRFKYIDFPFVAGADGLKIYKPIYTDIKFSYYQCLSLDFPNKGYARHNAFLQKCNFMIPPLAEQKRIVGKIEELFAEVDNGIDLLKQKQAELKKYRRSVLSAVFSGKLYKTTEWQTVQLKDICEKILGGGTPSKEVTEYFNGTIPFMTVKDMISTRPTDTQWHITEEAVKSCPTNIIPADTIIIATRVGLGKILRANFDTTINQDLRALFLKNNINKDFAEFLLIYLTPKIIAKGRGTTVKGISLPDLKSLSFMLPSLPEQEQIVAEIEQRFEKADILEKSIENALESAEKLKQSILKKAFEGKLVPQDPNDEPASVLLDRIKSEQTPKKGKKK